MAATGELTEPEKASYPGLWLEGGHLFGASVCTRARQYLSVFRATSDFGFSLTRLRH
jgi:hypothetical protein